MGNASLTHLTLLCLMHDLREQEARIRQLQNDAMLKALDRVKRAQDIRYAARTLVVTGLGAFGAAMALLKWIA